MQKKLDELKIKLQDALTKDEIIVDSITFEEKGKYHFLTITLDKIGGIDLETITAATHIDSHSTGNLTLSDCKEGGCKDKDAPSIWDIITDDSYILDVVSKERGE